MSIKTKQNKEAYELAQSVYCLCVILKKFSELMQDDVQLEELDYIIELAKILYHKSDYLYAMFINEEI